VANELHAADFAELARERSRRERRDLIPPWVMMALGALSLISLLLQHGFRLSAAFGWWFDRADVVLASCFAIALALRVARSPDVRETITRRRFEIGALALLLLALGIFAVVEERHLLPLLAFPHPTPREPVLFACVKVFLLLNVGFQALRTVRLIFAAGVRLELLFAGTFLGAIVLGMLLLLLPNASANPENPIGLMDALFTATSAVCVTGLGVRDTGTEFSTLGQLSILAMFQVGGLGIVTFVAFISAFSARTLPVPQIIAFRHMINAPEVSDLKRRLGGIVLLTLVVELAGVVLLYTALTGGDAITRLKWSVFHSVSAFCNAGFALQVDSLEFARANPVINGTIMTLIVLGGLGFLVLPEIIAQTAAAIRRLPWTLHLRRGVPPPAAPRVTVQTRMSLYVTLWLVVIGTGAFSLLEAQHYLRAMAPDESLLVSLFQSITTRTAGFNTVPIGQLTQATLLMLMLLMVIGGSPVSTAGGIKTVTFGVLFLAMRSMLYRQDKVEAYGRTLPQRVFFTALTVLVLYVTTAAAGIFLLAIFDPQLQLRDTSFEVVSALSTVGLSTGITAGLSNASKLVLCAAMFIGRVGPISLVFAVFHRRGKMDYEFPTEDVVVS
jgi:trk system potassium uptake protein